MTIVVMACLYFLGFFDIHTTKKVRRSHRTRNFPPQNCSDVGALLAHIGPVSGRALLPHVGNAQTLFLCPSVRFSFVFISRIATAPASNFSRYTENPAHCKHSKCSAFFNDLRRMSSDAMEERKPGSKHNAGRVKVAVLVEAVRRGTRKRGTLHV